MTIRFEPTGCDEADTWLALPAGQEAQEYMERFRCPDCGHLTDTPNHEYGCHGAAQREGERD